MVYKGRGFESTSWFLGDVGLSLQLCFFGGCGFESTSLFLGGGGSFFKILFYFDFLGDFFFKGNFFFFSFCFVVEVYLYLFNIYTFIHTIFFVFCGEV